MTDTEILEQPKTETPVPDQPQTPDTEARARAQGWRPKTEYRGPPERWVDAENFLNASEEFMGVARERNRALESKLSKAHDEITSLNGKVDNLTQVLTDFREFASYGEKRAYDKAIRELTERRNVAVQHADVDAFKAVDAEIAELNKSIQPVAEERKAKVEVPKAQVETPTAVVPPPDPLLLAWIDENPWFNSDGVLNSLARALDTDMERQRPGLARRDRWNAVKAEVQRRFPEKFENPLRENPSSVSAPSGRPAPKAAKHSYENLSPEAKKACDKFVKSIPGYTREEYVKAYDWGDD